jgi:uncharacterized protein (TIGR03086 family)
VLDATVTTFGRQVDVGDLIGMNPLDTTVHGWDLARATGVDDRLDAGLVRYCLTLVDALDAEGGPGRDPRDFAPALDRPPGDEQASLLAAVGRRSATPDGAPS